MKNSKKITRYCDCCSNSSFEDDRLICFFGHRPRFYSPAGFEDAILGNWGWKIGFCEEYEEKPCEKAQ